MTAAAQGVRPATPLPWELCHANNQRVRCKDGGAFLGVPVLDTRATYGDMGKQDAAYIVHAANAYPKLVALLKEYSEEYGHGSFLKLLRELGELE